MQFSFSKPNLRYGHLMPAEDTFRMGSEIFVVADGITRDPPDVADFTGRPMEEILAHYPNPSGARLAADTFCDAFTGAIAQGVSVPAAFVTANAAIAKLNAAHVPQPDYLVNDFFACVAAGGTIRGRTLAWTVVGDCGVAVFAADGSMKCISPNQVAVFEKFEAQGKVILDWNKPEGRKMVRSEYRNQPEKFIDDICASYGALTGETSVEAFIYSGTMALESGDTVVFFSDGFEPILTHPEFLPAIRNEKDPLGHLTELDSKLTASDMKYGKERTLIVVGI